MYLILILSSFCFLVNFSCGASLDPDIENLPAETKKELYHRIARRIFTEVKPKQSGNDTEVLVTQEQLQQQEAFVKKLLTEEQKKLRKSFGKNDTLKNDTDTGKPSEKVGDKKDLRNKNSEKDAMGFVDMTKRSSRKNLDPMDDINNPNLQTNATSSNKTEIKPGDGSTNSNATSSNTTQIKAGDGSTNSNGTTKLVPIVKSNELISSNLTSVNDNSSGIVDSNSIVLQAVSNSTPTDSSSSLQTSTTEETMIEIESFMNEPPHEFRAKDAEGEHLVKYQNISLSRSNDLNDSLSISTTKSYNETYMYVKTEWLNFTVSESNDETSTDSLISVTTNNNSIEMSKLTTIPDETTMISTTIENKMQSEDQKTTKAPKDNVIKEIQFAPVTVKSSIEPLITTEYTEAVSVLTTTSKPEDNLISKSNKEIDVNLSLALEEEKSKKQGDKVTKSKLNLHISKREDGPVTPLTTLSILMDDFKPKSTHKKVIFKVVTPPTIRPKDDRFSRLYKPTVFNKNAEPYFVFEAPADEPVFIPVTKGPRPVEEPSVINVEEPAMVPIHSYDPEHAYYNPNKFYAPDPNDHSNIFSGNLKLFMQDDKGTGSQNKSRNNFMDGAHTNDQPYFFDNAKGTIVEESKPMPAAVQTVFMPSTMKQKTITKIPEIDVATGNNNDIIFGNLNLRLKQAAAKKHRSDEYFSDDGYILNFLKKKRKTSKKLSFKAPIEKDTTLFKDNFDNEFIVIQDIIAQNDRDKQKKRDDNVSNFVLDTLFNTKSKLIIPKRKKKAAHNQFVEEFLKSFQKDKPITNSDTEEFLVIPEKWKKPKLNKQQEVKFLSDALKEVFEKPSLGNRNIKRKRSPDVNNVLRDDDIALDYYFERDLGNEDKVYDETGGGQAKEEGEGGEAPAESNESMSIENKSAEKVIRNEKAEKSEMTLLLEKLDKYLNQDIKKQKHKKLKSLLVNAKDKSKLKTHFKPNKKGKSHEKIDISPCPAKEDLNTYLHILQNMIYGNSDALANFDWLGTTVDIQASLRKLQELSSQFLKGEEIKQGDHQLFKFFVYLNKMGDEKIKRRKKCEEGPQDVFRYEDNSDEVIISPRDMTMKMKKDQNIDPIKLFNDYFFYVFKIKRTGAYAAEEKEDIKQLQQFVTILKKDMYDLHVAIKNVATVTEYASQNWYRDLKNIFLKSAKRKQMLSVLLHIIFIRILDMVEVALLDGVDKNYVKFIIEHIDDFEKILDKTVFLKDLIAAIAKK